jgi:hypothetical protein
LALGRDIHIAVLGGSGKIKQIHPLYDEKPIDVVLSKGALDIQPARFNFECRYFVRICEFHFLLNKEFVMGHGKTQISQFKEIFLPLLKRI